MLRHSTLTLLVIVGTSFTCVGNLWAVSPVAPFSGAFSEGFESFVVGRMPGSDGSQSGPFCVLGDQAKLSGKNGRVPPLGIWGTAGGLSLGSNGIAVPFAGEKGLRYWPEPRWLLSIHQYRPRDIVFDLNDDGVVDGIDRDEWRRQAATENGFGGAYLVGDAKLDGTVDQQDLNLLGLNWQQTSKTWSEGNFALVDGAHEFGKVDAVDLAALATNWRQSISHQTTAVPEPASWLLAVLTGFVIVRVPRNRSRV